MEYANMKEWLDKIIDATEHLISLEQYDSRIRTYGTTKQIPIDDHIEEIADCMGMHLEEEFHGFVEYCYRYFFRYRGYVVFQLNRERLESFAGTDREQDGC